MCAVKHTSLEGTVSPRFRFINEVMKYEQQKEAKSSGYLQLCLSVLNDSTQHYWAS